jgi:hypothetical protein
MAVFADPVEVTESVSNQCPTNLRISPDVKCWFLEDPPQVFVGLHLVHIYSRTVCRETRPDHFWLGSGQHFLSCFRMDACWKRQS